MNYFHCSYNTQLQEYPLTIHGCKNEKAPEIKGVRVCDPRRCPERKEKSRCS